MYGDIEELSFDQRCQVDDLVIRLTNEAKFYRGIIYEIIQWVEQKESLDKFYTNLTDSVHFWSTACCVGIPSDLENVVAKEIWKHYKEEVLGYGVEDPYGEQLSTKEEKENVESYVERQKACGLKVGDRVRITRKAESCEFGWENGWVDSMSHWVGKEVTIRNIHGKLGISTNECGSSFPYFVLEKVETEGEKSREDDNGKYITGDLELCKKAEKEGIVVEMLTAMGWCGDKSHTFTLAPHKYRVKREDVKHLLKQPEEPMSNFEVGDVVEITSTGGVFSTINRSNHISWPSPEIKKIGGESGWGSWYPNIGDIGRIIHTTNKDSATKLVLLQVGKYVVPINTNCVCYTTKPYVFNLTNPCANKPMNLKETETMKSLKVENVVFVTDQNNTRTEASNLNDEAIFNLISQLEAEIEKMNKINHKPKKLKGEIERLEGEIKALVDLVDNREESK